MWAIGLGKKFKNEVRRQAYMGKLGICLAIIGGVLLAAGPQIHNSLGQDLSSTGGAFLGLGIVFAYLGSKSK